MISEIRRRLLDLELAFIHGIEARMQDLTSVVDPRDGQLLDGIRLQEYAFGSHSRTDTQYAHRLLLRNGYTAHELESVINAMPVNRAIAYRVEIPGRRVLRAPAWRDSSVIVAGACWSPLDDLARRETGDLRQGVAADAARLVERLTFPEDAVVWLALAATTSWSGVPPYTLDGHVYCAYFEPGPVGGWMASPGSSASEPEHEWFARQFHPETDGQLAQRLDDWFQAEGRRTAMGPSGLTVQGVVSQAGVPHSIAEAFLKKMAINESGRWLYEEDKSRLVFLGP